MEDTSVAEEDVAMEKLRKSNEATEKSKSDEATEFEVKSRISKITFGSVATHQNTEIQQVEKDHYLYRRGSTAVHVQAYTGPSANEIKLRNEEDEKGFKGIKMISALLGIILFVITLAIKMSAAISEQASDSVVDQYMLTLYVTGTLWTSFYIIKGFFDDHDRVKFLKSSQKSNRWLKGVVVLFGLAIVLKNGLTFISYLMVNLSECSENNIKIAIEVFQALFVMCQTKYLFQYSKVFIRSHHNGSSTGLMMVISINLSTWLAAVIDETLHALHLGSLSSEGGTQTTQSYNSTVSLFVNNRAGDTSESENSACTCTTEFCDVASTAETFLFPFLIEYSLVASSLVYITWGNVGKNPPPCERVIKPSYKFYGRYRGSSLGSLVMFLTIVIIVLLGTTASDLPPPDKDYFSEADQLIYYDSFLFGVELVMFAATILGFYLFYRLSRPLEKAPYLDQILLVGCLLGPLVSNMFSLIAVISGTENRSTFWVFTLIQPLVDTLQCILQVVFVLYGLRREPITSTSAKETAAQLKTGLDEHVNSSMAHDGSKSPGFDNQTFIQSRKQSLTSVMNHLANNSDQESNLSNSDDNSKAELTASEEYESSVPSESNVDFNNRAILKIVSEMHVARPEGLRLLLRDVLMFLLLSNACLWVFLSLSGTAFVIFQYQTIFYGGSGWTTISMICRPLTIFFRMHSAGCLFEMWSFA